ncbi:MAG: PQQ-binding-like beta-propeller repeat protein [Verrucomicrobiae bacterium]|nr:PQQ-binding-like beta-propeller repeat protein [Verrucomicrobiae bacterium]
MKALLLPLLLSTFLAASSTSFADTSGWPAWRGDLLGSGKTSETKLPIEWGKDKNIKWRIDLPEPGNSTPVIQGERVFVTQPISETKWRGLMCFDRKDGSLLWKTGLTYDKEEPTHRANPYCSASPATDGEIVIAYYGSAGIAAYDFEGKQLWFRDLGPISHTWGHSTSPVLYGDLVIQYHGPGKNAALYALDKTTGEIVWQWQEPVWNPGERTDGFRDSKDGGGVIGSFSTPILVDTGERKELIMSFPMELKAFDPDTGEQLWTCGGLNPLVYTSPVYSESDKVVVAMGGYYGNSIGVKVGGNGDVTETHRLWQEVRHNGGIGTGVVVGHHYFYQDAGGIAYCDDMKTGKTLWKDRLPGAGKSWGSFVLAGDRIFTLSQAGDSVVFKADSEKFEVIAQSDLGEETNSSLAISEGDIFVRTHEGLWCVGESLQ